ncbi:conserved hypothetical protein [delta proteobacterium NaphS2]|nr:conserved hypothetical protein [delta proteobacterium NaphS2]
MDDKTVLTAENAVILIFTTHGITALSPLSQTVELTPIVPASWFLADISPNGSLVPQLRTGHFTGALGERPKTASDRRMSFHLSDGGKGSDAKAAVGSLPNPLKGIKTTNTHDLFRTKDPFAKATEQIGAARMESGFRCFQLLQGRF